jgi:hypothetical protein
MAMDIFITLIAVMFSQVYAYFKTYQILPFKYAPVNHTTDIFCQLSSKEAVLRRLKNKLRKKK